MASKMVKRKDRRTRRQILQLHEEKKPSKVHQHTLAQIGYSDSSEESEGEDASMENPSSNNEVKDVIDEQVADFLKEIDAISTATENEAPTDPAPEQHSSNGQTATEVQDLSALATPEAHSASLYASDAARENGGSTVDAEGWSCAWQQCQDEGTGYPYYWNVETNEVTWECPEEYLAYITRLSQAAAAAPPLPPPPEDTQPSEPVPNSTECATAPEEGKIVLITSYGSSSEESDGEACPRSKALRPSATKMRRHKTNLARGSNPLEYGPQLPAEVDEIVTSSAASSEPPPPGEEDSAPRNQRCEPRKMVVYGPTCPDEFGGDPREVEPHTAGSIVECSTFRHSPEESPTNYDPRLPAADSGAPAESESVARLMVYGPQLPSSSFVPSTDAVDGGVAYGSELPSTGVWSGSVESTAHSSEQYAKIGELSEGEGGSHVIDTCGTYGPQLPSSSQQSIVNCVPSIPSERESSAESGGVEENVEVVGSASALHALIGYSKSPTQEDDEVVSAGTTDDASVGDVGYPVMVGSHMCFGPTADTSRSKWNEDAEPDSTTRVTASGPTRPHVSACDVASSSGAQAPHLVSYGESDSEEDAAVGVDIPSATSSHHVDVDTPPRSPQPSATRKCSSKFVRSPTRRDGDHPGFGFSGLKGADTASKVLCRKKRLMNVKFVKSEEVLFLSGKQLDDDSQRSEKEEIENGIVEDSTIEEQGSDDEFDDVVRALDQALMESRKKEQQEKKLVEVDTASGQEVGNTGAASTEAEQLEVQETPETPKSEPDMVIDSPSEAEPIIHVENKEDTAEIEATLVLVMAKLAHFNASPVLDVIMHDLAVQVQTRMEDWRAGALDPKYCRAKLREAHDFLQLREASTTLPLGWSCHWDSGTMRYFYTEEMTGRSQWEFPTEDQRAANGVDPGYGPQQLPTVTSSTSETFAAASVPAVVVSSGSEARGEKRKAVDTVDAASENNRSATGEVVPYCPEAPSAAETVSPAEPPSEVSQRGDSELPSTSAEDAVASSSKRKKTKLSAGLALRKKNIPSLLQKWEKIKKEQKREDLKQNL